MKKLLILFLIGITSVLTQINANNITYTINYSNETWDGVGNFDTIRSNWDGMSIVPIINNSIIIEDITKFFIIVFFDNNENYLGYQNSYIHSYEPSAWTTYKLGTVNNNTISIPNNAVYFAVMNHKVTYSDADGTIVGVSTTDFENNTN